MKYKLSCRVWLKYKSHSFKVELNELELELEEMSYINLIKAIKPLCSNLIDLLSPSELYSLMNKCFRRKIAPNSLKFCRVANVILLNKNGEKVEILKRRK